MIFPGMDLTHHSAYAGTIVSDDYEKVLGDVADLFIHLDDFNVRELLTIRANFVLALYDKNALFPQNSIRLQAAAPIQI